MKIKGKLQSLLCLTLLTACGSGAVSPVPQTPYPSLVQPSTTSSGAPGLLGVAWEDRTPYEAGLVKDSRTVLEELPGASVYHIDLRLADDLLHYEAEQQVRYTNLEEVPLREVYLRLFPRLFGATVEVESVAVDGHAVSVAYEYGGSAMRLSLPSALQPGDAATLELRYSSSVPDRSEGNYGVFGYVDGILSLAHFYPIVAVYDDEGWNVEIPPPNGDVIYADSSFYLVRISAPAAFSLVASGVRIAEEEGEGCRIATYAAGPVRDFYLAGSEGYQLTSRQIEETTVNSFAPFGFEQGADAVAAYAEASLRIFGQRFGPYPFTELDLVGTPTLALGVEYPGILALALRIYPPLTSYSHEYLESTTAHEVAHQWFYSVVGNDQLDEPWLDEALAQYATLLYYEDTYGPEGKAGFRASLEARWERVEEEPIPVGKPVREYTTLEYGAIVYGRAPLFLEALAREMGEDTFDDFLRRYYQQHQWGIASTSSFRAVAEQSCSCDLGPLFEGWVYAE